MTTRQISKAKRLAERKVKAIELLGGKCVNCGSIERLQFDHIKRDRVEKKRVITIMINSTTWENVLEELKKCQLLCFSCHIKKSNAERGRTGFYNHGTANRYRAGCRCELCTDYNKAYMKQYHRKRKLSVV